MSLDIAAYVMMQQVEHVHMHNSAASYNCQVTCTGLEALVVLHHRQERCVTENAQHCTSICLDVVLRAAKTYTVPTESVIRRWEALLCATRVTQALDTMKIAATARIHPRFSLSS